MRVQQFSSLFWKQVLPVPLTIVVVIILTVIFLPGFLADNARQDAVHTAKQTAAQFKTVRGYYTRNVIKKVVADGNLKPSYEHKSMDKGVPLPATFIHDLSKLLDKTDVQLKLTSPYPFPNRTARKLDDFQKSAWAFLTENPGAVFVQSDVRDGREVVRVGIADTMVAQGCVNCHNSRADTPKDDWKLGDVRGVLEISAVIDAQLARGAAVNRTVMIATVVVGLALTLMAVFSVRQISAPIQAMTSVMGDIAAGRTDLDVPAQDRDDEVGAIAAAVEVFRRGIIEKDRLEAEQKDVSVRAAQEKTDLIQGLAKNLEKSVGGIAEAVSSTASEVKTSVQSMSGLAEKSHVEASSAVSAAEDASLSV